MNKKEFLCGLLNRGYNQRFYDLLEEEMFDDDVSQKIVRALKNGFKFSKYHLGDFRKVSDIRLSDLTDIAELADKYEGWLTEDDVMRFVNDYRKVKAKEYLLAGDVDKALEFTRPAESIRDEGLMESYQRHLEEIREGADKGLVGLTTGLNMLDGVTGGLIPSKIWIVAGYNAYGKTYFMTNIINNLIDLDKRVCVVTLEMTREDILDRLIGQRLGLGVFTLAKTENKQKVAEVVDVIDKHIQEKDLCILDSGYTVDEIISRVKIENTNRHIDVLCLDFIQLVSVNGVKSIYEKTSYVAQELQKLTKELGCCSILLSQVSNSSQSGSDGDVYGFKGAGEIGQIADVAIKIKRNKDGLGGFTSEYILDLVKNRSGKTGELVCKIDFPSGEISEDINLSETFDE